MITAKVGQFAYMDAFTAGLVPCRTLDMRQRDGRTEMLVKLTAKRPGYERRETLWEPHDYIVPRPALYTRRGEFFPRIRPYRWEQD